MVSMAGNLMVQVLFSHTKLGPIPLTYKTTYEGLDYNPKVHGSLLQR